MSCQCFIQTQQAASNRFDVSLLGKAARTDMNSDWSQHVTV